MANILALRSGAGLEKNGLEVYGDPSAIVAVKMGTEATARLVSRALTGLGLIANMVEYPAVPKGAARFRLQVMAGHTARQIEAAVACMKAGFEIAALELEDILLPRGARAVA